MNNILRIFLEDMQQISLEGADCFATIKFVCFSYFSSGITASVVSKKLKKLTNEKISSLKLPISFALGACLIQQ